MLVKWPVCSSSTPTIQLQISLKISPLKIVLENTENQRKEAGVAHLLNYFLIFLVYLKLGL